MFSQQEDIKHVCTVCKSTRFYKADGLYFCSICQTQVPDMVERVADEFDDPDIRTTKVTINYKKKDDNVDGWTSWELYNYALIGIVDELIALGASPKIKLTVLQLWAKYLKKIEVAFTSTKARIVPKLSTKFYKRDADIIYGKVKRIKKQRRKAAEKARSENNAGTIGQVYSRQAKKFATADYERYLGTQDCDSNASTTSESATSSIASSLRTLKNQPLNRFNKISQEQSRVTLKRSMNLPRSKRAKYRETLSQRVYVQPATLTLSTLFGIVFLALRIENQNITISDLVRFIHEGHLSFYRFDALFPDDASIPIKEKTYYQWYTDVSHYHFRTVVSRLSHFLEVFHLAKPDMGKLIKQYCKELQLPRGIKLYAKRLLALTQPELKFKFGSEIPTYEARAMAYIIVVLKLLFGFDGVTEFEISKLAEEMNRKALKNNVLDSTLFSFREWQWYIECRRFWVASEHMPTRVKYDMEDSECNYLYSQFFENMKKASDTVYKSTKSASSVKTDLVDAYNLWLQKLNGKNFDIETGEEFLPSLTPMHSYLQQMLNDPKYNLPDILKVNFKQLKVGYLIKPKKIIDLGVQCGLKIKVLNTNLNYLEKKVAISGKRCAPMYLSIVKQQVKVDIRDNVLKRKSESNIELTQQSEKMAVKINDRKQQLYDKLESKKVELDPPMHAHKFCFNEVTSDGKLMIPDDSDSEEEEETTAETKSLTDKILFDCEKKNLVEKLPKYVLRRKRVFWVRTTGPDHNTKRFVPVSRYPKGDSWKNDPTWIAEDLSSNNEEGESEQEPEPENQPEFGEAGDERILYRPFKEYWMHHCKDDHFYAVSNDNNHSLKKMEQELPSSFNWLLSECAHTLEMKKFDLYQEVCLLEAVLYCHFNQGKGATKNWKRIYQSMVRRINNSW